MRLSSAAFFLATLVITAILYGSDADAATTRKTVSMPSNSSVLSGGTATLTGAVLDITMPSVEYIPNASIESRALANMSKGVSLAESGIINGVKSGLKNNAASLAITATMTALLAGVDWIMTDGVLRKKTTGSLVPYNHTGDQYYWTNGTGYEFSDGQSACDGYGQYIVNGTTLTPIITMTSTRTNQYNCVVKTSDWHGGQTTVALNGSSCPSGSTFDQQKMGCVGSGSTQPLVESDYDVIDGFVKGQDGVWQQGLVNDLCSGSDADKCIANLGATPIIKGPSAVNLPDVVTTTSTSNSDGTVTTTTDTTKTGYSLAYGPSYVDMTPTTTTTTTSSTKDGTGTTTSTSTSTSTTTSTTTTDTPAEEPSYDFQDPDFPKVDPFYTQKYPDGMKGVWEARKSELLGSSFMTFLNGFIPTFSGSCPTFGLSFDIMSHANFGYVTFSSLCYIFDFIKVIMLVTAMFTCRAIIFGG